MGCVLDARFDDVFADIGVRARIVRDRIVVLIPALLDQIVIRRHRGGGRSVGFANIIRLQLLQIGLGVPHELLEQPILQSIDRPVGNAGVHGDFRHHSHYPDIAVIPHIRLNLGGDRPFVYAGQERTVVFVHDDVLRFLQPALKLQPVRVVRIADVLRIERHAVVPGQRSQDDDDIVLKLQTRRNVREEVGERHDLYARIGRFHLPGDFVQESEEHRRLVIRLVRVHGRAVLRNERRRAERALLKIMRIVDADTDVVDRIF